MYRPQSTTQRRRHRTSTDGTANRWSVPLSFCSLIYFVLLLQLYAQSCLVLSHPQFTASRISLLQSSQSAHSAAMAYRAVLSDFHWGGEFRLAMTDREPRDYSGHGGCQIGKRRIVVHKYTGLAKWNRVLLRGLESIPQRGSAELSGGQLPHVGVKPPDYPVKYSPVGVRCQLPTIRS